MTHSDILSSLTVSTHRLTRHAAQSTGQSTTSATYIALAVLQAEGPHRLGDLAKAALISQPGMTKVVQNLVSDEWVYRIADVDDSRAWLIDLTPKGREALARWRADVAAALVPRFDDLSEADWDVLRAAADILASRAALAEVADAA